MHYRVIEHLYAGGYVRCHRAPRCDAQCTCACADQEVVWPQVELQRSRIIKLGKSPTR